MQLNNYIIKYAVYSKDDVFLKSGKMRVKKCMSDLHAQIKFEGFLKSKFPNFGSLIVYSCYLEDPLVSKIFEGVFDKENPFMR